MSSGEWRITGPDGFDDLKIGESRSTVRERLGDFEVFRRTPDAPEADDFLHRGVQVTYDEHGRVSFMEIVAPENPELKGVGLLGRAIDDVVGDLRALRVDVVEDSDGAYLPAWRLGLFAIGGVVEGVSVNEEPRA